MNASRRKLGLPRPALRRLPIYYRRLRQAIEQETTYLSSSALAQSAGVSEAQVRKDLSHLDLYGRSGVGDDVVEMATFLEEFLGLVNDLALIAGAVLKFAWLYGVTAWLVANPLQLVAGGAAQAVKLPPTLVTMMQWPQLATALAGGLIALGVTFGLGRLAGQGDR